MAEEMEEVVQEKNINPHNNIDVYEVEEGEDSEQIEEEQINPSMEKAMKGGWAPREKWKGDPDDWVDYKEFNYRGELMGHIKSSNDKVAELSKHAKVQQEALAKMAQIHKKELEAQKKRLLEELEAEKIEAINEGRGEDVIATDKKLKQVEEEFAKELAEDETTDADEEKEEAPQYPQEFVSWQEQNKDWYGVDQIKTRKADLLAEQYLIDEYEKTGKQPPHQEVLDYVTEKITGTKPASKQQAHQEIEPGATAPVRNKSNGTKNQYTVKDLTPEEYPVVKQMAEASGMKIQEYVNSLAELGELEIQQK